MTAGHDSAAPAPRHSLTVAALGAVVFGLIQLALLITGLLTLPLEWRPARKMIRVWMER